MMNDSILLKPFEYGVLSTKEVDDKFEEDVSTMIIRLFSSNKGNYGIQMAFEFLSNALYPFKLALKKAAHYPSNAMVKWTNCIPHLRHAEHKRSRLLRNHRTLNHAYEGVLSEGAVRERFVLLNSYNSFYKSLLGNLDCD